MRSKAIPSSFGSLIIRNSLFVSGHFTSIINPHQVPGFITKFTQSQEQTLILLNSFPFFRLMIGELPLLSIYLLIASRLRRYKAYVYKDSYK